MGVTGRVITSTYAILLLGIVYSCDVLGFACPRDCCSYLDVSYSILEGELEYL